MRANMCKFLRYILVCFDDNDYLSTIYQKSIESMIFEEAKAQSDPKAQNDPMKQQTCVILLG